MRDCIVCNYKHSICYDFTPPLVIAFDVGLCVASIEYKKNFVMSLCVCGCVCVCVTINMSMYVGVFVWSCYTASSYMVFDVCASVGVCVSVCESAL